MIHRKKWRFHPEVMLERAAQRNQTTLEAHLKEFSEEGLVRANITNIFHHDAGRKPRILIEHIPYPGLELVISFPRNHHAFLGFMNGGRDSLLLDMGSQVEDAVYITLRASESCSDANIIIS